MTTRPLRKIFIVRLWSEPSEQWAWQGEVQVAQTGETQRIHSAGELLDYLQATMTAVPPTAPPEGLR